MSARPGCTSFLDRQVALLDPVTEAAIDALLRNSTDLLALVGADARLRYLSPAVEDVLGAPSETFVGRPVLDLVHPDDVNAMRANLRRILRTGVSSGPLRCRVLCRDGGVRSIEVVGSHVGDVAGLDGAVLLNSRDVTDVEAREEQLAYERSHDVVTGLGDERQLASAVGQQLAADATNLTVLAIGIDDLRGLAGGRGPDAQDAIVRLLVERAAARQVDPTRRTAIMTARVGTSTFLVLCADSDEAHDPLAMGEEARQTFAEALTLDGRTLRPSISVGVVDVRPDRRSDSDPGVIIERAMLGLREARAQGGGLTVVVDDALVDGAQRSEAMARDLRSAVEALTLEVHYQPKVALHSGQVLGCEALARWTHPTWGAVPPPVFIEVAEEHGIIEELGRWVLYRALRDASGWRVPPGGRPLGVAVNVSACQLTPALAPQVADALARSGVAPGRLTLEVTESTVMGDLDAAVAVLTDLKALGVRLSIDDFGTGHSSLAQLRRLPIDELKIDKSFVDGLGTAREDTAIVAAVTAMAHALGLGVVAEGVEEEVQRAELWRLGAEEAQGYLFWPPQTSADIDGLTEGRGLDPAAAPRGKSVVVADDSPEVLQLLGVSLAAAGYTPYPVPDGAAALAAIRRIRPVAAVLDISMPGLRGTEVCRLVRADPTVAGCTVVALSAHSSAEAHIEAFQAGADEYVVKPFSPRDIVSRTAAAIERRRAGGAGSTVEIGEPVAAGCR